MTGDFRLSKTSFVFVQEQKVRDENEKVDAKLSKEDEDPAELRELTVEERYVKLMDLLNKSKFYSKFLQEKMASEDEQTQKLKANKLAERKSLQLKNGKKVNVTRQDGHSQNVTPVPSVRRVLYEAKLVPPPSVDV